MRHCSPTGLAIAVFLLALHRACGAVGAGEPAGPLRVSTSNPRYFAKPDGKPVLLAGAHDGWELQDFAWGDTAREHPFAWTEFLEECARYGHNTLRLWVVEHTKLVDDDADLTEPMAYQRVPGHGLAHDGLDRFDLAQLNPVYFARLKQRVQEARAKGFYVLVMLFQGWSVEDKQGKVNPWPYHPFHRDNNLNGMDADLDGDGQGRELQTWLGPDHPITRLQRQYIARVIETLQDEDNVLYEIGNECHPDSLEWQNQTVDFIRQLENRSSGRHPVGITVPFGAPRRADLNERLLESHADWISPNRDAQRGYNYRDNPPVASGHKIILSDSDHLHGNRLQDHRWVWKTICRGHNVLFMDQWTEARNDPKRILIRQSLGHVLRFSRRLDLAQCRPSLERASTRYCLEEPGVHYLVYQPSTGQFTVTLEDVSGPFHAEWFQPTTGATQEAGRVAGGASVTFDAPFPGDAVLWLEAVK